MSSNDNPSNTQWIVRHKEDIQPILENEDITLMFESRLIDALQDSLFFIHTPIMHIINPKSRTIFAPKPLPTLDLGTKSGDLDANVNKNSPSPRLRGEGLTREPGRAWTIPRSCQDV